MEPPKTPIDRAIAAAKGQSALAKRLGISQAMVHKWKAGAQITAERAKQIEDATGGLVKRHELRPDIFDAPAAAPVYCVVETTKHPTTRTEEITTS